MYSSLCLRAQRQRACIPLETLAVFGLHCFFNLHVKHFNSCPVCLGSHVIDPASPSGAWFCTFGVSGSFAIDLIGPDVLNSNWVAYMGQRPWAGPLHRGDCHPLTPAGELTGPVFSFGRCVCHWLTLRLHLHQGEDTASRIFYAVKCKSILFILAVRWRSFNFVQLPSITYYALTLPSLYCNAFFWRQ